MNNEIRLANHNGFNEYKVNSRKTWQIINELTSRKSGRESVTSLKVNGVSITNPTMLSNEFNNHFATISLKLASNISTPDSDYNYLKYLTNTDKQFQLCPTTTDNVLSLLNKLNKSKATGLDMISAWLIRDFVDLICIPICNIFNQSIGQSIFPDDWKCARVAPLFKVGDRNDVNNYRPISVISVVAKLFERIVCDQ